MLQKRWVLWLIVLGGLLVLGQGSGLALRMQDHTTVGGVIQQISNWAIGLWILWGLWSWRERTWARKILWWWFTAMTCALLAWLCHLANWPAASLTLIGIWAMTWVFILGLALMRLALSPGNPVLGVARTLVDEAIRMKVALIFIILVLLAVPLLPLFLASEERLTYRIQSFLVASLTATSIFLSLMTVFLACGSICNEIRQRQIYMTMVKPIGRAQYLLGKWMGIALLNLLLITVCGGSIYTFARVMQRAGNPSGREQFDVEEQVLAARQAVKPVPLDVEDHATKVKQRIEQLIVEHPERYRKGTQKVFDAALMIERNLWHNIGPGEHQTYVFKNLDQGPRYGRSVQFRIKPRLTRFANSDGFVRFKMWFNHRPWPLSSDGAHMPMEVARRIFHVINLPVRYIDEQGTLAIQIQNTTPTSSINFEVGKGMEILFHVGRFEPNLIRALMMIWIKLGFLTCIGLAGGTFLSFAVACVGSLLIYITASISDYLIGALGSYAVLDVTDKSWWEKITYTIGGMYTLIVDEGQVGQAFQVVIRLVGELFMLISPSLSQFNPIPNIADGRVVAMSTVGMALAKVGLLWGGIFALIGWLIFRKRELARVVV